ncbi:MAG: undecaprenyl/decaprenyl-phosphate alpha-N-acetylglucosaminyl 1-phosphate transferase, partial [Chitinophagia bacterium]|nr:undecaprenyl/decaprenyl-phosphate alpha-N-acetylglucosaminyl 1-phosphate transferase [Chitinophagia bacterium]
MLLSPYIMSILVMLLAAVISVYTVRKIIFITTRRRIYDVPDNVRKIHGANIPSLGGTGIFTGFALTLPFFTDATFRASLVYLFLSALILFFTGVYDDIMNMSPVKKLLAQLMASAITVYFAGLQLPATLLGTLTMAPLLNLAVTTLLCTFFINVFNFIDGIDGLACMLSVFYTATLGGLFLFHYYYAEAYWAFSLTGATLGLLFFNYAPARIYMGDTGSMLTGFCIFMLCVQ